MQAVVIVVFSGPFSGAVDFSACKTVRRRRSQSRITCRNVITAECSCCDITNITFDPIVIRSTLFAMAAIFQQNVGTSNIYCITTVSPLTSTSELAVEPIRYYLNTSQLARRSRPGRALN